MLYVGIFPAGRPTNGTSSGKRFVCVLIHSAKQIGAQTHDERWWGVNLGVKIGVSRDVKNRYCTPAADIAF